ncbi:MAG: TonB-dependent receptor [Desulfobacteraceae bacterium 4572_35.1]|nr:MAG: TonB-dependent receptor [Desulfobacteraceae bacterium 4572_35.1]
MFKMKSGIQILAFLLLTATISMAANNNDEAVFTLGEVIVTGERQTVNLATTVTEISASDLELRGAENVAEALKLLPGIYIQTADNNRSEETVSIRGFEQSDVKILVDGVAIYGQYDHVLDLSLIPVDSIAKITITKGASSVLYGANTMGGVINIVTKQGTSKPQTEISTSFGDYGTQNYSVSHGGSSDEINYWVNYTFRESDGFRLSSDFDTHGKYGIGTTLNEDGGKRNGSDYIKQSISAKLGYTPDDNSQLYLTMNYVNNEKGIPNNDWFFSDWQQWQLSLVGEHRFSDQLRIRTNVFYIDQDNTLKDTDTTNKGWFYKSGRNNYSTGGEVQAFWNVGSNNFLKMGASFTRDNSQHSEAVTPGASWQDTGEYESDIYSLAVEDEITINDWLSLVIGTSWDYYDPRKAEDDGVDQPVPDADTSFNPQIGVVITASDATTIHASVGKKTRFPHLKELFSDLVGGNPDLSPQKTIAYEIGVDYQFSPGIDGSLAYFYNDVNDLIQRDSIFQGSDYVSYYRNIGSARIQGLEATLNADITAQLHTSFNYTYMLTKDKDTGRELPGRPRHRANFDLRYDFSFGLLVSAQGSYTQRQFYDYKVSKKDPGAWIEMPDYFLLNMRFEQQLPQLLGVDSKLFLQLDNLTDKDYTNYDYLQPGRSFLVGMNAKF